MTLMRSAISLCLLFTVSHLPGGSWPRCTSPMKPEFRIPEKHPYLGLTPAKIERAAKSAMLELFPKQFRLHPDEQIHYTVMEYSEGSQPRFVDPKFAIKDPQIVRLIDPKGLIEAVKPGRTEL